MGERLGKVAHEPTRDRVVLLGQQAEVVAQVEEPLEELAGIVVTTQQRQAVSHPERAGQEGTFSAGEAVDLARVGERAMGSGEAAVAVLGSKRAARAIEAFRAK